MKKELQQKRKELEILVKQFNELNNQLQNIKQQILKTQGAIEALEELDKK